MTVFEKFLRNRNVKQFNYHCGDGGLKWFSYTTDDGIEMEITQDKGRFKISLFNGSFVITYKRDQTIEECVQDVIDNYDKYRTEDWNAWYRAYCD